MTPFAASAATFKIYFLRSQPPTAQIQIPYQLLLSSPSRTLNVVPNAPHGSSEGNVKPKNGGTVKAPIRRFKSAKEA